MVCYYFYKNIVLVFTEIYFATSNGYSGQIFFADWLPMLYNALWTSWQCLFAYVLEQVRYNLTHRMQTITILIGIHSYTRQGRKASTSPSLSFGDGLRFQYGTA